MKSIRILLATALLLCTFGVGAAFAQDITIINGTGYTIKALGLDDSDTSTDAEDLLGDSTLAPGARLKVSLTGSPKGWELIAQDKAGRQTNWPNLDLTGVRKITLLNDGSATFE